MDSVDAFSLLQNMAPMSYDSSRLIDVACISFSTTDHVHLAGLQARHRQTVLAQFAVSSLNNTVAPLLLGALDSVAHTSTATKMPASCLLLLLMFNAHCLTTCSIQGTQIRQVR